MDGQQDQTLFNFKAKNIDGQDVDLSTYKGKAKAFLIVNVASACGYTDKDYKELTALYNELHSKGLEIFAFPCNQFGAQEPKCELDIKKFATDTYSVKFPLFSKVDVNGDHSSPLYTWLRSQGKVEKIAWNFSKFLLDRNGKVVAYKKHDQSPFSFRNEIEALLN